MFQKIIDLVLNFFDTKDEVSHSETRIKREEDAIEDYYKLEPDESGFYRAETNLKMIKNRINSMELPYNKLSEDLIVNLKSYQGVEHQILWNLDIGTEKIECVFITPFKIFLLTTQYINCDIIKALNSDTWEYHYGKTIHREENPLISNRRKGEALSKFLEVDRSNIEEIVVFVSTGKMEEDFSNKHLVFLNDKQINLLKSLLFFRIEEEHLLTFTNEEIFKLTEKLFKCMK